MRSEALKGHLDGLLLAALQDGPLHGYAVIAQLHARSRGAIDLPTGTVYPALHRLERSGLVASDWTRVSGRRRRVYSLTHEGQRALGDERHRWDEFVTAMEGVLGARASLGHAEA